MTGVLDRVPRNPPQWAIDWMFYGRRPEGVETVTFERASYPRTQKIKKRGRGFTKPPIRKSRKDARRAFKAARRSMRASAG